MQHLRLCFLGGWADRFAGWPDRLHEYRIRHRNFVLTPDHYIAERHLQEQYVARGTCLTALRPHCSRASLCDNKQIKRAPHTLQLLSSRLVCYNVFDVYKITLCFPYKFFPLTIRFIMLRNIFLILHRLGRAHEKTFYFLKIRADLS